MARVLTLADHLRACGIPTIAAEGMTAFRAAIEADPDLERQARGRLATIDDDDLCRRCFVTRRTREHLRQALQLETDRV